MDNNTPVINNYDAAYDNFSWDVPEHYNFALDVVDKRADTADKVALITVESDGKDSVQHKFSELKRESSKFANLLASLGIKKGDRVILMAPRIPEWYFCCLGLNKLGVVFIPTPTLSMPKDIDYRSNKSGALAIVTTSELAHRVDEVADKIPNVKHKIILQGTRDGWVSYENEMAKMDENFNIDDHGGKTHKDDEFCIYFTSGTVSYPKMVLHTQKYPIGHLATAQMIQDLREDDVQWTIADTGWAKTAYGKLYGQWIIGATVVQWNAVGKFDAQVPLNIIQDYDVSVFCAPPTVFRQLILQKNLADFNFAKLRHCMSAGEPLNPEVIKTWQDEKGLEIYDYYGQSETVALIGNCRAFPIRPGSMGKPTLGHELHIIDENGDILPNGEEGQIALKIDPVRPPGLMKEYAAAPDSNAKVFNGHWYLTGDKAYKDDDGYFWFVGRADDVIKSSGYRIGPFEVESALIEHDAVAESAVIGVPDEMRGALVKAFIILNKGYEGNDALKKELQDFVKKTTAPYKYPREIEFVTELPKTISGKIRRSELRKRELAKRG